MADGTEACLEAGKFRFVLNAGENGCTTLVDDLATGKRVWQFEVEGGCRGMSFAGSDICVATPSAMHLVGGKTPAEPVPVGGPQAATISSDAELANIPITAFSGNRMPEEWAVSGPFPSSDLDVDFLVASGGRAAAIPMPGSVVRWEGEDVGVGTCGPDQTWRDGKFTGGITSLDLTAVAADHWLSTWYFTTVIESDRARDVRFALFSPGGQQWNKPDRVVACAWLGGRRVADGDSARIMKGRTVFTVQVGYGKMSGSGKIWVAPRLLDETRKYAALRAEYDERLAAWKAFCAADGRPFILAQPKAGRASTSP